MNRFKVTNWKVDEDGRMRIHLRMLKEGVFEYGVAELGGLNEESGNTVNVYIPAYEFTPESLKSAEGINVVINEHEWRDASNTFTDGYTVGQVAGSPSVVTTEGNTYIECDAIIANPDIVDKIKSKGLCEISAGYKADFVKKSGTFDGKDYDYIQKNIVFNHILLLPYGSGRCGVDVKIMNRRTDKMAYIVKHKVGNSVRTLRFNNEDDARQAEQTLDEVIRNCDESMVKLEEAEKVKNEAIDEIAELKAENESLKAENCELQALNSRIENIENCIEEIKAENCALKEENESLKTANEELEAKIEELKEENEILNSDEYHEEIAEEIAEQKSDEEAVMNSEFEEEEREEVLNSIKAKNRADRMCEIAKRVLNKRGVDASEWDVARLIGSFQTIAATSKVGNKKNSVSGVNAIRTVNTNSAKDRMFAHYPKK